MTAMGRTGTKKLFIKKENFELSLEREDENSVQRPRIYEGTDLAGRMHHTDAWLRADQALSNNSDMPPAYIHHGVPSASQKDDPLSIFVTSPMVGTYYSAASPDQETFVKVGDKVENETVVCVIEAMKVMNEIKANITGTIAEVLVEAGQPVEFGTKLFRVLE